MKIYLTHAFIIIFISTQLSAKALRHPRIKRNALRDRNRLWPNAVVHYTLSLEFNPSERQVIRRAMKNIESVSCIRFRKRYWEKGYIDIRKPENGCSAHVGYRRRRRELDLAPNCIKVQIVLHEFFHVLGFEHEHVRPDRDDFITVNEDNINPDELYNFKKESSDEYTALGLPYDFDSIMHYKDTNFAINKSKKTLKRIGSNSAIKQSPTLSKIDILKLNKLYRCHEEEI